MCVCMLYIGATRYIAASGKKTEVWEDPKSRSTIGDRYTGLDIDIDLYWFCNLHHRSFRVQNLGLCLWILPGLLQIRGPFFWVSL